jgi:hypothetical protein
VIHPPAGGSDFIADIGYRTMSSDADRDFVEYIIKAIVNNPDKVEVTRVVDELGVLLTVKVAAEDMGLLIGRSGSTAKAVRTLARIVGMRNNARVNLKIEEPEGGRMTKEAEPLSGLGDGKEKTLDDALDGLEM